MIERPLRFAMEQPVEFRLTDMRGGPRHQGRTINISSNGVLLQTDQRIGVGRRLEIFVKMAKLTPDSVEVDLRMQGMSVRSGDGWVAVQVKKHQILPRSRTEAQRLPPGRATRLASSATRAREQ